MASRAVLAVVGVVWASWLLAANSQVPEDLPVTTCRKYVPESETLNCSCRPPANATAGTSAYWLDRPINASLLTVENVTMQSDNGTQFTCGMFSNGQTTVTIYTLLVAYPPPSPPAVTTNSSDPDGPLKNGDVLTCSVTGGYPPLTDGSLLFYCSGPDIGDENDVISADGQTISSVVRIDTAESTVVNMTCACTALWTPDRALYKDASNTSFSLEYKAASPNVTLNGTQSVHTAEADQSTLTFACESSGRPDPTLSLFAPRNTTPMARSLRTLAHTIDNARCEDAGDYTCEADNGFPSPHSAAVTLVVDCAPRLFLNRTTASGPSLPPVFTFLMVAYPVARVSAIRNVTETTGNMTETSGVPVSDGAFSHVCHAGHPLFYTVRCVLTPAVQAARTAGRYRVTFDNGVGALTLDISLDAIAGKDDDDTGSLTPGAIAGVVVGSVVALLLLAVIIVVAVILFRRHEAQDL